MTFYFFQNLTEEESSINIQNNDLFDNYSQIYFTDLFGSNISTEDVFRLIFMQLLRNPEKYLKLSLSKNNFETLISDAVEYTANFSEEKLNLQSTFSKLNMSEKVFSSYFSFLWYSSLPCFDIANLTAEQEGDSAMLKKCYWKDHLIPCSAIFKKVSESIIQTAKRK